jgi:enamine deaminase RidA (YjgF/YER057c/UK114 family)
MILAVIHRKDAKKLHKLEAQIPYFEGRGNVEEVTKIKHQIEEVMSHSKAQLQSAH